MSKKIEKFNIFFFTIFLIFINFIFISNNNTPLNLYVYYSFISSFNGFKPGVTLYSKDEKIKSFFNGEILYYNNSYKYCDNYYNSFYIIKLNENVKLILTNVNIICDKNKILENESDIIIENNLFDIFIIKDGKYLNPIEYFKFRNYSKPYISNIYYVDEVGSLNYFREFYSKKSLSIGVKAYILQFIDKITKYNSFNEILVYINEKLVFEKKFLYENYNEFINLKKYFYDEYTVIIPNLPVNSGKNKLKILITDFNNNVAIREKNFTISGE